MRSESVSSKLNNFHTTFKHPVDINYPSLNSVDKIILLRRKLIEEEYNEVIEAIAIKKQTKFLKSCAI